MSIFAIWLAIDLLFVGIAWVAYQEIRPRHPMWWRGHVMDYEEEGR